MKIDKNRNKENGKLRKFGFANVSVFLNKENLSISISSATSFHVLLRDCRDTRIFGISNTGGRSGRFSGCGLRDRAQGFRDSRDRAESHRASPIIARFLENYSNRYEKLVP